MDPFSITVGIVGLVDGGLSLSKELKDKIDSFKDAGSEIVELAHEVDLCTTLVDVLGNGLDRPESVYPANVIKQTKRLVEDMRNIFSDIRGLVADYDYSHRASARYVVNAEELKLHHSKLKSLQLSFVFMLSVCPPQRPADQNAGISTSSVGTSAPAGSFEGTIQHIPVQLNGAPGSMPTTYTATLTLHPLATVPSGDGGLGPPAPRPDETAKPEQSMSGKLEDARKDHELKKKLKNLSRSPFFSKDGFRDMLTAPRMAKTEAATYSMSEPILIPGAAEGAADSVDTEPDTTTYEAVVEVPVEAQYSVPSDEQADREVDEILGYLFDPEPAAEELDTAEYAQADEVETVIPDTSAELDVRRLPGMDAGSPPSRYSTPSTGMEQPR